MRLLLDSHILVWHKMDDARLSQDCSAKLESVEYSFHVSIATFWELQIKESMARLEITDGVDGLHQDWIESEVATVLPIRWKHLQQLRELPPIHRDPFDRLLIAQAMVEHLIIVSCDENIKKYPNVEVWS